MSEYSPNQPIAVGVGSRSSFLIRTYSHLLGAVFAFVGIEWFLFSSGLAAQIAVGMLRTSWLLILAGFMMAGWLARSVVHRSSNVALHYLALAGYIVAQALIFVPMLYVAEANFPGAIGSAAQLTILAFVTLTFVVFATRKNFSFLRPLMIWGGLMALGAIVVGVLFKVELGFWFSAAMALFAGAAVLYDTSKIYHDYPEDRHVAAALQLFASVALMFWYILRLFMSRD